MQWFEYLVPSGAIMLGTCLYWHAAYSDAVLDSLMFRDSRMSTSVGTWVVHLGAAATLVWAAWRLSL